MATKYQPISVFVSGQHFTHSARLDQFLYYLFTRYLISFWEGILLFWGEGTNPTATTTTRMEIRKMNARPKNKKRKKEAQKINKLSVYWSVVPNAKGQLSTSKNKAIKVANKTRPINRWVKGHVKATTMACSR